MSLTQQQMESIVLKLAVDSLAPQILQALLLHATLNPNALLSDALVHVPSKILSATDENIWYNYRTLSSSK